MGFSKNNTEVMGVGTAVPLLLGAFRRGTPKPGGTIFTDGGGMIPTTVEREEEEGMGNPE